MTRDLPSPDLLRKLLRYEPETGKLFWRERTLELCASEKSQKIWNNRSAGKEAFTAISSDGYHIGAVMSKGLLAHRVIWALRYGEWPKNEIDHINGNRADNRIKNLRHVEKYLNQRNRKKSSNNTSGYNGVIWRKDKNCWAAIMHISGKRAYLGFFKDIKEAAAARATAEANHGYTKRHGS